MTGARAALRRRLRGDREAGLSLVELIVAIMITGVVMSIVATMFVNVAKVTANSNGTNSRTSVAANVMNEISEVLSTASNNPTASSDKADPAIVSGTASALTIYSFVDTSPVAPAPSKVTFRVDANGTGWEDRVAATSSGGYWVFSGATTTRNLGGPVATADLFTYLDQANATVDPGAGLTLAQRGTITSIKVSVTIANNPTLGSDPVVIVNTVSMPNLLLTDTDS